MYVLLILFIGMRLSCGPRRPGCTGYGCMGRGVDWFIGIVGFHLFVGVKLL